MHLLVHLLMKLFVLIVQCSVSYLFEMTIVDGEYEISLFRGDDNIESAAFPELKLTAQQVFQAGLTADEIAANTDIG